MTNSSPTTIPSSAAPATTAAVDSKDLGQGFSLNNTTGWVVVTPFTELRDVDARCSYRAGGVTNERVWVNVVLVSQGCGDPSLINGQPFTFSDGDRFDDYVQDVEGWSTRSVMTDVGELILGRVRYAEYTEESREYEPVVGVLTLTQSPVGGFPTLALYNEHEGVTEEDLIALGEAIRIGQT